MNKNIKIALMLMVLGGTALPLTGCDIINGFIFDMPQAS